MSEPLLKKFAPGQQVDLHTANLLRIKHEQVAKAVAVATAATKTPAAPRKAAKKRG